MATDARLALGEAEVALRPLTPADLDAVFAWERDPEAVELAAFTRADPSDRTAFDAHHARIAARDDVLQRAITLDGELVGTIATFDIEGDRELTYWIDRRSWGRGIASAAVRLLLELEPARPLHARVADHNLGSRRVLERAGFVRVGEERSWADGVAREVLEHLYRLDRPNPSPGRAAPAVTEDLR